MAKQTPFEKDLLRDMRQSIRVLDAMGKHKAADLGRAEVDAMVKAIKDRKEDQSDGQG